MKTIRTVAMLLALAAAAMMSGEAVAESSAAGPKAAAAAQGLVLAQVKTRQQTDKPARANQTRFKAPARVPAGQLLYVQKAGQSAFNKFVTGAPLGDLDCIEVNCPASFPAGATCWRCTEQVQAPTAPGSE